MGTVFILDEHRRFLLHCMSPLPTVCVAQGRIKDGQLIGQNGLGKIWMALREQIREANVRKSSVRAVWTAVMCVCCQYASLYEE